MNTLFLRALRCEPVERPPVWLMRQAGRYMPQYRALRTSHTLWEMFHNPELAAEVTCQPLEHLGVDAAILFSDILVIVESLGLSVQFPNQGGPRVEPAISGASDIDALSLLPVQESLSYVFETIHLVKAATPVPLIGFSGGPFTIATYCLDPLNHGSFAQTQKWIQEDPQSLHLLLEKITTVTIAYLKGQIEAGVDALQIFDSWANILTDEQFAQFSLPYLQRIIDALRPSGIPVIVFCRDSSLRAEQLATLHPNAISFDWHLPMKQLRQKVPPHIAVQGNFHPEFLKGSFAQIEQGVEELLTSMEGEKGFIVNLGHGVTPDIPFENVRHFVNRVKEGIAGTRRG